MPWQQDGSVVETIKTNYLSGLSTYQVAKIVGCSQNTVHSCVKKLGINRTQSLSKTLTPPKYRRKNFEGDSRQKAYLLGFRIGDLHVSQTSPVSKTIRVATNSTKLAQINLFNKLFSPYGHTWRGRPDRRGAIKIRSYLNLTFSYLLPKTEIPSWLTSDQENIIAFCAGYFDAEGTVCLIRNMAVASVKSQDKQVIFLFYQLLSDLGILCGPPLLGRIAGHVDKRGIRNNKDVWQVSIYRKDALMRFFEVFEGYLQHDDRLEQVRLAKENIILRSSWRDTGDRKSGS